MGFGLDGVEKDASGAPSAFRIWKAGENPTDHGMSVFSKKSAKMLLDEQSVRGNLYSIDFDHASLDVKAPPEARRAAGWFQLDVRDGELWATNVQWTEVAKAGLTKDPPEFRYFSPAYDQDKNDEVVSLINLALTNNPATWSVTALATSGARKDTAMNYEECMAALNGDDMEKRAAAHAAIKAAFGDEEPDGDEPKKKEEAKASEEEPEMKKDAEDDADKKAAAAADDDDKVKASILATVGAQDRRIRELEALRASEERARLYASRKDLTDSQKKVLDGEPVEKLVKLLALIPAPAADLAAASRVTATVGVGRDGAGDSSSYGHVRAARLPQAEHEELVQKMGGSSGQSTIGWDKNNSFALCFPQISKDQAREILATRHRSGAGQPRNPADKKVGA